MNTTSHGGPRPVDDDAGESPFEATPPPVAAAIRSFADNLQDIAMNALTGVSNDDPAQATRLRDGEAASARIADLCK